MAGPGLGWPFELPSCTADYDAVGEANQPEFAIGHEPLALDEVDPERMRLQRLVDALARHLVRVSAAVKDDVLLHVTCYALRAASGILKPTAASDKLRAASRPRSLVILTTSVS